MKKFKIRVFEYKFDTLYPTGEERTFATAEAVLASLLHFSNLGRFCTVDEVVEETV